MIKFHIINNGPINSTASFLAASKYCKRCNIDYLEQLEPNSGALIASRLDFDCEMRKEDDTNMFQMIKEAVEGAAVNE